MHKIEVTDLLIKILKTESFPAQFEYEKEEYLHYEELDDIPTHKLICFTYNFIDFLKYNDFKYLKRFTKELESFKIIKKDFLLIKEAINAKKFLRDLKIYLHEIKEAFLKIKPNFKKRNYLINLLNYLYLDSLEYLRYEMVENKVYKERRPPSVFHIDVKGKKKELFVDRNQPTLSLDDYAKKIMDAVKNRDNQIQQEVKREMTEEERRKLDDFNDDLIKDKRNMG